MSTVFDHGAVGDGITDDTAAFQAAAATGELVAPALTPTGARAVYVVTDTVDVSDCIVTLDGTVDARTMPAATSLNQRVVFAASGIKGTATAMPAVSSGTGGFTVANDFTPGDLLLFECDDRPVPGLTRAVLRTGELKRVASADAQYFQTTSPTYFQYTTTPTVSRITPTRVHISGGGRILCGGVGSGHNGIRVTYSINPTVSIDVEGAEDVAIGFIACWAPVAEKALIENSTSPSSIGNTGYGVLFSEATFAGRAHEMVLHNCRHGIAGGGLLPAIYCSIDRCVSDKAPLDCHEPTFEWQFFGNTVTGGADAFLIRGQHVDVVLNRIFGVVKGVRIKTWDGATIQESVRSILNRVRRASDGAVTVEGEATEIDPISLKPGLMLLGDLVEKSGSGTGASVAISRAIDAVVDLVTRHNYGDRAVEVSQSRLQDFTVRGDTATVALTNTAVVDSAEND